MKLIQKFIKIKEEIGSIQKDASNPFAKSKYATLTTILEHVNPILNKHNVLFVIQFNLDENIPNMYKVVATLTNVDDATEQLNYSFSVPLDDTQKNPVQGFGSTMTYGQRYVYGCVFGIAFNDDDPDSGKTTGANCESQETDKRVWINPGTKEWTNAVSKKISIAEVKKHYRISKVNEDKYLESIR